MASISGSRSLPRAFIACAAGVLLAGCDPAPTAPSLEQGPAIAHSSLTAVDASQLPCCGVDSAGVRATLVGGTLTFYRLAHYTDTVFTPAGPRSGACVISVPNGAAINITGVVTLPDGARYLVLPCDAGTYTLALAQRLDFVGGSSRTDTTVVTSGAFRISNWSPDTLSLVDSPTGASLVTALAADTITVAVAGHRYSFTTAVVR